MEPKVSASAAERTPDLPTWIFTFGYGHVCPFTGKSLGDHYVTVAAPDRSSARTLMNATFNRQWAFEYDGPSDPRIADYVPRMTEHAQLAIGGPMPQKRVDTGLDYGREDLVADDPTPVSPARVPLHTGGVVDGDELVDETPVPELAYIAPTADGGVVWAMRTKPQCSPECLEAYATKKTFATQHLDTCPVAHTEAQR